MKKVKYAVGTGAIGLAPALGIILAPAGNAAAAVANPGRTGKTVTLEQRAIPVITCGRSHSGQGGTTGFLMVAHWSGVDCIHSVSDVLGHSQSGLEMRTRAYAEPGGTRIFSNFVHGTIQGGFTLFGTLLNIHAEQVCTALVNSVTHAVVYQPECFNFGP